MTTANEVAALFANVAEWQADAAVIMGDLGARRAALLAQAKRMKMTAGVKRLLTLPPMPGAEPVAATAPGPYPGTTGAQDGDGLDKAVDLTPIPALVRK